MGSRTLHLPATLASVLAVTALVPVAATAQVTKVDHMYNDRYCEYLMVKGTLPDQLTADVWNTYGLNDCPSAWWRASDAGALAKEFGARTVKINGPRHWLIDHSSIKVAPGLRKLHDFNGFTMRRIAQVRIPLTNGVPGLAAYTATTVLRANTFTWSRRNTVHELVGPDKRVYVMQSYAQTVEPTMKKAALRHLGSRLKRPAGWSYRTRRLERDLALTTTGKAVVVQDELENTYQLERAANPKSQPKRNGS